MLKRMRIAGLILALCSRPEQPGLGGAREAADKGSVEVLSPSSSSVSPARARPGSESAWVDFGPVDAVFDRLDVTRDGRLDASELAAVALDPRDAPVDADGDGVISRGEYRASLGRVRRRPWVREIPPGSLQLSRVRLAVGEGKLAEALRIANELQGRHADSMDMLQIRGEILRRLGKPAEAEAAFRKMTVLGPDDPAGWVYLAIVEDMQGKKAASKEHLKRGLMQAATSIVEPPPALNRERHNRGVDSLICAAAEYLAEEGCTGEAAELVRWGVEHLGPRPTLTALDCWARAAAGTPGRALEEVDDLLRRIPNLSILLHAKGRILEALGRRDAAIALYREALSMEDFPMDRHAIRRSLERCLAGAAGSPAAAPISGAAKAGLAPRASPRFPLGASGPEPRSPARAGSPAR